MVVMYLVFNEGYAASFGDRWCGTSYATRPSASGACSSSCSGARRAEGPARAHAPARLAARDAPGRRGRHRAARGSGPDALGSRADRRGRGPGRGRAARRGRATGPYALQAAIAAVHAQAPTAGDTDWRQITALYGVLARVHPSPVDRAQPRGRRRDGGRTRPRPGPDGCLDAAASWPDIICCPPPGPSSCAGWAARRGRRSYRRALELVGNGTERRHLERRLRDRLVGGWRARPAGTGAEQARAPPLLAPFLRPPPRPGRLEELHQSS